MHFLSKNVVKDDFFILFGDFSPTREFLNIWRRHHCRWRAANFDLCSALMAIEQWGFFNVPHQLWYGASVYNGHLRGPVTLTPIAEHLAMQLSLPVFNDLGLWRLGFEPQNFRSLGESSNQLRNHRGWFFKTFFSSSTFKYRYICGNLLQKSEIYTFMQYSSINNVRYLEKS